MLHRPRRNRRSEAIRAIVRENHLTPDHLMLPLFLIDGHNIKNEIFSLPGNFQMSIDQMLSYIESSVEMGIVNFVIFPVVEESLKDKTASASINPDLFYLEAVRKIKSSFPEVTLMSDVALDPYSSDGHDGYVEDGKILNDKTLPILADMAVAQAQAGFDYIGPSDMMDGRVKVIREALDNNGYNQTGIISYTAKYASAMYGPFRDALDSAPKSGDKKSYQMDPANSRESLIEGALDTKEGADMLMVKPALHYLDVIHQMHSNFNLPIAAYHVSGECAMLKAACDKGWLDFNQAMPETLLSIRRAGASLILTYFARDFAQWYRG